MNILFVEDSIASSLPVTIFLTKQGHHVVHAFNGESAIELFQQQVFDLVLMDVVMSGMMDGITTTQKLRTFSTQRWVPILIMTGSSHSQEIIDGLCAGADGYLIKPINLQLLDARIRSMRRVGYIQDSLISILDNANDAIITLNSNGLIKTFNKAAERIFGYSYKEIHLLSVNTIIPNQQLYTHIDVKANVVLDVNTKFTGYRKNGEVFPVSVSISEIDDAGEPLFILIIRDISKEEEDNRRIEFLAMHDPLTHLPNRAHFDKVLKIAENNQDNCSCALLFIDLDRFKPINDELGHHAGDQALITIAQRLRRSLKRNDIVARLGGDEFVALLYDINGCEQAKSVAQRVLNVLMQPMSLLGKTCSVGASIGVALMPLHGTKTSEVLTAADNAMYIAKRSGKGCVVIANEPNVPN
jgi:diguanylate cyclase (GGDEF)-like protein/PAS domain S-box-containing protein